MLTQIRLFTPLEDRENLYAGDRALLSGTLIVARDAAHKRFIELMDAGKELPVNLEGKVIFYAGPTPAPEGRPTGSIGPTTASRMDAFAVPLMEKLNLAATIGKGQRSREFKEACVRFKGVYFAAIGGIAALMSRYVVSSEVIAFEDLGTEAVRKLVVKDFPLIVAYDTRGGDIYEKSRRVHGQPLEQILKNI